MSKLGDAQSFNQKLLFLIAGLLLIGLLLDIGIIGQKQVIICDVHGDCANVSFNEKALVTKGS